MKIIFSFKNVLFDSCDGEIFNNGDDIYIYISGNVCIRSGWQVCLHVRVHVCRYGVLVCRGGVGFKCVCACVCVCTCACV